MRSDQPTRIAPAPTALRDSLWLRLLDSLGPGGVLQKTIEWSLLLNQVPKELGGGAAALENRTVDEFELLRSRIDAGSPCPIGLVISNTDIWYQHQILVHGYEITGPDQATLYVYDSNSPSQFGSTTHGEVTLDFRGQTWWPPRHTAAHHSPGSTAANMRRRPRSEARRRTASS